MIEFFLPILSAFGLFTELSTRARTQEERTVHRSDWVRPPRLAATGLDPFPGSGGAAFYGPKVPCRSRGRHRPYVADSRRSSTTSIQPERFDLSTRPPTASRRAPSRSIREGSVERFRRSH